MERPRFAGRSARALALAAVSLAFSACLARPPAESAPARLGTVRAATSARAQHVARAFDTLAPLVLAELPGASIEPLEVWVQETPTLYVLRASTYSDTDGFWAEGVRRIHLRDAADHLERTLAHELVHASLAPEWDALPGTIEEGLCDVVAARVVPEAARRLRSGRLATAAAALGGLPIEVDLWLESEPDGAVIARGLEARLRIVGEGEARVDPLDVFVVRAGLSTARAEPAARRAFYGIGFLVAERIEARIGFAGLHALCVETIASGARHVAPAALLRAADLESDAESFRSAILESLGPEDLREILRLHPGMLVEPVADILHAGIDVDPWRELASVRGRIRISGCPASAVQVLDVTALRPRLETIAAARREARFASELGKNLVAGASDSAR